jgi:pSer/pThr/pTyr-binding forkhead associated (FHA) protein
MRVKLVVIQGRPKGKRFVFPPGDYYFGRGDECQVRLNSAMISRQHCLLRVKDTGISIRDLGSRNGTLVNGVLISKEQRLRLGDQIQLGSLVLELQEEEGEAAAAPPVVLGTESLPEIVLPNAGDPPSSTDETKKQRPYKK